MNIETPSAGDFERIFELLTALWPKYNLNYDSMRELYEGDLRSGRKMYLVAREDQKIVGVIDIVVHPEFRFGKIAIIDEFIVDDSYQGKGIGSALLREAEKLAKQYGCKRIELHSALERTDAHKFYQDRGYEGTSYYFKKRLN